MKTIPFTSLGCAPALLIALLLFGLLGAPPSIAQTKRVALLIGINDYPSSPLFGPVNDVAALKVRLPNIGYASENIVALVDKQASKAAIMRELAKLETRSASGDDVLIYFSGHGTSEKDKGLLLPLFHDSGAWLPHGFESARGAKDAGENLIIGRTDLRPILKRLDEGGRNVLVISDSCFSGNLTRSVSLAGSGKPITRNYNGAPVFTRSAASDDAFLNATDLNVGTRPSRPSWPFANLVQISSASDDQPSVDLARPEDLRHTIDNKPQGTLTNGLLRILDGKHPMGRTGTPPTYSQLHQALAEYMLTLPPALQSTPTILPAVTDSNAGAVNRSVGGLKVVAPSDAAQPKRMTLEFRGFSGTEVLAWKSKLPEADVVASNAMFVMQKNPNGRGSQLFTRSNNYILDDNGAGTDVRQRLIAETWLRSALPSKPFNAGLRADTRPAGLGGVVLFGDAIRFAISLQQSAELLVVSIDSKGKLSVLYPNQRSEVRTHGAGVMVSLPSETECITVQEPAGLDRVAVVALPAGTIPPNWTGQGFQELLSSDQRPTMLRAWLARARGETTWIDLNTQPRVANSRAAYACLASVR